MSGLAFNRNIISCYYCLRFTYIPVLKKETCMPKCVQRKRQIYDQLFQITIDRFIIIMARCIQNQKLYIVSFFSLLLYCVMVAFYGSGGWYFCLLHPLLSDMWLVIIIMFGRYFLCFRIMIWEISRSVEMSGLLKKTISMKLKVIIVEFELFLLFF